MSKSAAEEGHEKRVQRIIQRARRETGMRDFLILSMARMWTVLLVLAAVVYTLFQRWREPLQGRRSAAK